MPRLNRRHQVTVPNEARERLGFRAGMVVRFVVEGDRCYLVPEGRREPAASSFVAWLGYLRTGETTEEVMAALRGREGPPGR